MGKNNYGQLGDNSTTQRNVPVAVYTAGVLSGKSVTSISGGHFNTCVIAGGAPYCWGAGTNGALGNGGTSQSTIPVAVDTSGVLSGKTLDTVSSSGFDSSCVLDTAGLAYCWGTGTNGQLGNNASSNSTVPVAVTTSGWLSGKTIQSISANGETVGHVCVVTTDYSGYCWGSNSASQLGTKLVASGSGLKSAVAVPIFTENALFNSSPWRTFTNTDSVTPGGALAATNTPPSVTSNASFRLRTGIRSTALMSSISGGSSYGCGISKSNLVYCWGDNTYGQLGNNSTTASSSPVAVDMSGVLSGKTITAVSSGEGHTCAIASDNKAYCWGRNVNGQLGDNKVCGTTNCLVPVAVNTTGVLSGKTVKAISAEGSHTCVIASDNKAYCWGYNTYGQVGNNSTTDTSVPVAVDATGVFSGKTIKYISAGYNHTCAVASDSLAYCWGYNSKGELGNSSTTQSNIPVAVTATGVLSGKTITAISSGGSTAGSHTCAVASDANAYCWGYNVSGQLGNNSTGDSSVAVAVNTSGVLSSKTVKTISAGGSHTCVIASDDEAYCWGADGSGQLGDNATTNNSVPVAVNVSGVLSGKTVAVLEIGGSHSCAIASDNEIYCWGANGSGQLGVSSDTVNPSLVPVMITMSAIPGPTFDTGDNTFKLQFAELSAATCSAQTTGFNDVTTSSTVAYNDNVSVANGAAISTIANDPISSTDATAQTYQDAPGTFTNTSSISSGKTGLWDFSLKTISATTNVNYCLRMTYGDGTALEQPMYYPEIAVVPGVLSLGFVDDNGNDISQPTFGFSAANVVTASTQTTTGSLGDTLHQLRLFNSLVTNGWTVSLAATAGPSAVWNRSDSLATYDFNGTSSTGQLSVNPGAAIITPKSGCSATGVSSGGSGNFVQGVSDTITLMNGSSATALNCHWDLKSAALTQTIPAAQPAGTYTIDMTATMVAQ